MSTNRPSNNELTASDKRLFEEALRRAKSCRFNAGLDSVAIERAIIAELTRGIRDMHGLVRSVTQLATSQQVAPKQVLPE